MKPRKKQIELLAKELWTVAYQSAAKKYPWIWDRNGTWEVMLCTFPDGVKYGFRAIAKHLLTKSK